MSEEPKRRLSYSERMAIYKAEHRTKEEARAAERKAEHQAKFGGESNDDRVIRVMKDHIKQLRNSYRPEDRRRADGLQAQLEKLEEKRTEKAAEVERREAAEADAPTALSRAYIRDCEKAGTVPPEHAVAFAEIKGWVLASSDGQENWRRIKELESTIWDEADAKAQKSFAAKTVAEGEFQSAAGQAEQARSRAEHAAKLAEGPQARDESGKFVAKPSQDGDAAE